MPLSLFRFRSVPSLISVNDAHYVDAYPPSPTLALTRAILTRSKPKSGLVCDTVL